MVRIVDSSAVSIGSGAVIVDSGGQSAGKGGGREGREEEDDWWYGKRRAYGEEGEDCRGRAGSLGAGRRDLRGAHGIGRFQQRLRLRGARMRLVSMQLGSPLVTFGERRKNGRRWNPPHRSPMGGACVWHRNNEPSYVCSFSLLACCGARRIPVSSVE
eukprot:3400884-Prymnesium_polylepis.1